jgi:hypothetical protein
MFRIRILCYTAVALGLLVLTVPARASVVYSYCASGCTNSNSGMTYSSFQSAASTFASTFSSPITFVASDLNASGIYTDSTTGTVFTGYNASQTQEALIIGSGASLAQTGNSVSGKDRSIGITLPANTYAVGLFLSTTSGFASPYIVQLLSDFNLSNANYTVSISNSGDSQFFGIISNTPLSNLYLGDLLFNQSPIRITSLEIGQSGGSVSATPEPATFALIGVGLIALRFLRKRVRDASQP